MSLHRRLPRFVFLAKCVLSSSSRHLTRHFRILGNVARTQSSPVFVSKAVKLTPIFSYKEEKEWLDALQHELTAKKGVEQLNLKLAEAQGQNAELADVLSVRAATKAELDQLYNSIFNGPNPDIPGEDEKENAVRDAEQDFNAVQLRLSTENQAKAILLDASKFLQRAVGDIRSALDSNQMDCFGFGDSFAAMSENSSLSACQSHVSQVEMLVSQANRVQPAIPPHIGGMEVARMNFMG
jgi:hypothetical protein